MMSSADTDGDGRGEGYYLYDALGRRVMKIAGDTTTAADSSTNGYDGTLNNGPGWCPGKIAGCLSFDGSDDYVALGNPTNLNFSGQITIAAWVYPTASDGIRNIVAHGYRLSPNAEVYLKIENGQYRIGSWDGTPHNAAYNIPSGDLNTWVHLVGVYDGTTWRLYRNGTEVATNADTTGALTMTADWAIGARGTGTERFFEGGIDDVRIYNRGVSAQEAANLYGGTEVSSGLQARWQLDDAVTRYAMAGNQVLAEYAADADGDIALSRKFVYGAYIDEPLMMINADGGTETEYFYHRNRNYNVIALTDENGNEVERYTYSAYGEVVVLVDGGTGNPYFFTGRRLDDETGLMYYRARYYDGELGRFIGRDMAEYIDGHNLYMAYFMAIARLDPNGLSDYIIGNDDPDVKQKPAGDWGSKKKTALYWSIKKTIQGNLFQLENILPDAVRHLRHYFDNSGSDLNIVLGRFIRDVNSAELNYRREAWEAIDFVEQNLNKE